jgi:hypothetical protein
MRNGAGGDPKSGSSGGGRISGGGRVRTAVQRVIRGGGTVGESTILQEQARNTREAQSQVQIAEGKGTFGGKRSTESTTAKESFRKAKEANAIPRSQQPADTYMTKDHNTGKSLRTFDFKSSTGEKVTIRRDNPVTYKKGTNGHQGKHHNAGTTGTKLQQHHNYKK